MREVTPVSPKISVEQCLVFNEKVSRPTSFENINFISYGFDKCNSENKIQELHVNGTYNKNIPKTQFYFPLFVQL